MLRAALHVGLDPELLQLLPQQHREIGDARLALFAAGLHQARDLLVRPRVEGLEREILELPLHLLDTETVGKRGIDLKRLGRDPLLLRGRQRRERAHVVEAVGELDQQHPDVARHGHDHLADVLGLRELARLEVEPVELREAVDDPPDLLAELPIDPLHGERRVLDRVVQERGLERHRIQPEVGEDHGDRDGVLDVLLAGEAVLTLVRGFGRAVRVLQRAEVGLRVVGADLLEERLQSCGGLRLAAAQARTRDASAPPCGGRRRLDTDLLGAVHVRPVYARDQRLLVRT